MSLRSKLSRLGAVPGPPLAPPPAAPPPAAPGGAARHDVLDDLRARIRATLERSAAGRPARALRPVEGPDLPFSTVETASGPLHVRTRRLPVTHRTGRASVAGARQASAELLALLALDPRLAACDPARALYLDTETTGLAGGTGTVAFLLGMAWWDGEGTDAALVVEQLLVRALGEEAPMLERVRERIAAASMLVTYNGKSFDLPLLRTRFVMTRTEPPVEPPHLDLLHVARRVHGKRLAEGCRLIHLEKWVLGFERVDDVPSSDVSAVYLHFLRTGEAGSLLGVIEHNAWDVVAMASLLGLYGEPAQDGLAAEDLVGVARTLHRAGALERAASVADAAVARAATAGSYRARADIAKARGDRRAALEDFERAAASVDDASIRLELAKLYEHAAKAPERALEWVGRGTGETPEHAERRAQRLARKAERQRQRTLEGLEPGAGAGAAPACEPARRTTSRTPRRTTRRES